MRGAAAAAVTSCRDAPEWDALVRRVPWAMPQHAFGFGEALSSCFGHLVPERLVVRRDGRVVAGLPLVRFSTLPPFRALYSMCFDMYGGPLVDPDALAEGPALVAALGEAVDRRARALGAFEIRYALPPRLPDALRAPLVEAGAVTARECPLLRLDRPLEDVEGGYRPAVRRAIRRAARSGVHVEEHSDAAAIGDVYGLYRRRMREIGVTPKPRRFIEEVLRRDLAVAFVARRGAVVAGLLIVLLSPRTAVYWIGAMNPDLRGIRPMNALLDAAIRWCHARGVEVLSLGESYGARPGLVRFKRAWGPTPGWSSFVIRPYRPRVRRTWLAAEPLAREVYARWQELRSAWGALRERRG